VPSEFSALATLTVDELQLLNEDEAFRAAFLGTTEEMMRFEAQAAAKREETTRLASRNSELADEIKLANDLIMALQAKCAQKEAEMQQLAAKQSAVMTLFQPEKIASDLDNASRDLDRASHSIGMDFVESKRFTDPSGVKDFREAFIALRKRYHLTRMKSTIIAQSGLTRS
jgi:molecular chaperone GrpE (heat shock protein)